MNSSNPSGFATSSGSAKRSRRWGGAMSCTLRIPLEGWATRLIAALLAVALASTIYWI